MMLETAADQLARGASKYTPRTLKGVLLRSAPQ